MGYKDSKSLSQRVVESTNVRRKFPNKIPIIVEKASRIASDIPEINKSKYLVPGDLSFGQFIYVIRKQLQLPPDKALFLFVNNVLLPSSILMMEAYSHYVDLDGFMYVVYSGESTFGAQ